MIAPGRGATLPDADTNPSPETPTTRPSPRTTVRDARAGRRRRTARRRGAARAAARRRSSAGVCALAAAAALAAVVLPGSGDDPSTKTTGSPPPGGDAGAARSRSPGKPMHGIESPLSLTSTGGTVWVSGRARSLALYDAHTGIRVQTRPDVGAGAHAIAAGARLDLGAQRHDERAAADRRAQPGAGRRTRPARSPRRARPSSSRPATARSGSASARATPRNDYVLRDRSRRRWPPRDPRGGRRAGPRRLRALAVGHQPRRVDRDADQHVDAAGQERHPGRRRPEGRSPSAPARSGWRRPGTTR